MQTSDSQSTSGTSKEPVLYDLSAMVRLLRANWRFTVGCAFALGIALFCFSILLPTTYKATTVVMPPDRSSSSLSMFGGGGSSNSVGALASLSLKTPSDLYVALMSSVSVEDSVIRKFNLQKQYKEKYLSRARKEFETNLQVSADPKSGLISISFVDRNAETSAKVANAIVDQFLKTSTSLAMTDASRRRMFFDRQVDETKQNLNRAEEAIRGVKNRTGLIEPEGDARALITFQEQLHAQITTKTVELQSMRVYLSDENPQVQTAQRELQALESQAEALNRKSGGDTSNSKNAATDASLEYLRDLREFKYNETLLELLVKNLEIAKLDEAREGSIVQVVDVATPPDIKYGPHRSLFLAGGFVIGFLLSFLWLFIRQFLAGTGQQLLPSND